jgi:hypothetical protein
VAPRADEKDGDLDRVAHLLAVGRRSGHQESVAVVLIAMRSRRIRRRTMPSAGSPGRPPRPDTAVDETGAHARDRRGRHLLGPAS